MGVWQDPFLTSKIRKGTPLRLKLAVVGLAAALACVSWQCPSFAGDGGQGSGTGDGPEAGQGSGSGDAGEADANLGGDPVTFEAGVDSGAEQGDASEGDASAECPVQGGGGQGQQQDNPNCPTSGGSSGGCSVESTTLPDLGGLGMGLVCAATLVVSRKRRRT